MAREVWQLQKMASLLCCALRVPTPELICRKDGMQFQRRKCRCLLPHARFPLIKNQVLYQLLLCMDANFRLKNQLVSNYSQDPGPWNGVGVHGSAGAV